MGRVPNAVGLVYGVPVSPTAQVDQFLSSVRRASGDVLDLLFDMSPNNVILVAHTVDKSYVFDRVDADSEWSEEWARARIASGNHRYTRHRKNALVLAHDMQNRIHTEYGVREMFLEARPKRVRRVVA